jgi:hypothetical protein
MTKKRRAVRRSKSARTRQTAATGTVRHAMSIAIRPANTVKERVAALARVPTAVCEDDQNLQSVLKVLRNEDEPVKVRLAALQAIQAASFSVVAFESCRGDYIATLRAVAEDPDPELRQRVLGILAREKDGFAQKKLLAGLQDPDKALVPPEKALQLLGYDVHAEAYQAAREIVRKPPNATAKREALRLLAADATAAPMFEKILRDKSETRDNRQISAAALNVLNPQKLQANAREIVLDTSEHDDIQATSLSAITQFGASEAVSKDTTLMKRVDRLRGTGSSKLKHGARQFLSKYSR